MQAAQDTADEQPKQTGGAPDNEARDQLPSGQERQPEAQRRTLWADMTDDEEELSTVGNGQAPRTVRHPPLAPSVVHAPSASSYTARPISSQSPKVGSYQPLSSSSRRGGGGDRSGNSGKPRPQSGFSSRGGDRDHRDRDHRDRDRDRDRDYRNRDKGNRSAEDNMGGGHSRYRDFDRDKDRDRGMNAHRRGPPLSTGGGMTVPTPSPARAPTPSAATRGPRLKVNISAFLARKDDGETRDPNIFGTGKRREEKPEAEAEQTGGTTTGDVKHVSGTAPAEETEEKKNEGAKQVDNEPPPNPEQPNSSTLSQSEQSKEPTAGSNEPPPIPKEQQSSVPKDIKQSQPSDKTDETGGQPAQCQQQPPPQSWRPSPAQSPAVGPVQQPLQTVPADVQQAPLAGRPGAPGSPQPIALSRPATSLYGPGWIAPGASATMAHQLLMDSAPPHPSMLYSAGGVAVGPDGAYLMPAPWGEPAAVTRPPPYGYLPGQEELMQRFVQPPPYAAAYTPNQFLYAQPMGAYMMINPSGAPTTEQAAAQMRPGIPPDRQAGGWTGSECPPAKIVTMPSQSSHAQVPAQSVPAQPTSTAAAPPPPPPPPRRNQQTSHHNDSANGHSSSGAQGGSHQAPQSGSGGPRRRNSRNEQSNKQRSQVGGRPQTAGKGNSGGRNEKHQAHRSILSIETSSGRKGGESGAGPNGSEGASTSTAYTAKQQQTRKSWAAVVGGSGS